MKRFFPITVFVAGALISLALAGYAYFAGQEAARIKFEAVVNDAQDRVESRMELHLSLLRATKALFYTHDGDVSAKEYSSFFTSLDIPNHFAGLHGIGFLRLVKAGDEAAVEQRLRSDFGGERKIRPPAEGPWRAVITLVEPLNPYSERVLGFDMMTDTMRRQAIETALASDDAHASGLLMMGDIAGASRSFPGFMVFARLTQQNAQGAPEAIGLVYNAFRSQELFQTALAKAPLLPVNVEIYDGEVGADTLIFRSETRPSPSLGENLRSMRRFQFAGRQWTILFRPTSAFSSPSSGAVPVLLGLFGLLMAGAVALLARYQQQALEAVSTLHETTEKSLLEKDLMLQEMKHRIKNSIARVLAIARQTAAHATDIDEFSSSFAARLQAMSVSQDMLTRSRWQKADLRDLLRTELAQVFGKDLPEGLLEGPQVLLDETSTQALGLTFHELATNALKYGDPGNLFNALKIDWRLEGRGRERKLVLNWQETGHEGLRAPSETGFGTKLIDLNITRELGGEIARDFRADGLKARIRIPLPA